MFGIKEIGYRGSRCLFICQNIYVESISLFDSNDAERGIQIFGRRLSNGRWQDVQRLPLFAPEHRNLIFSTVDFVFCLHWFFSVSLRHNSCRFRCPLATYLPHKTHYTIPHLMCLMFTIRHFTALFNCCSQHLIKSVQYFTNCWSILSLLPKCCFLVSVTASQYFVFFVIFSILNDELQKNRKMLFNPHYHF